MQICIQVNIDAGATKPDVTLEDAQALAQAQVASKLPRLVLRG